MNTKPTHGQPIDYFELEQHRLHHLANSMTLAITEGFGEYVDTREWQQDDPSFGFGRVGSPILYTSLNDRDDGKYLPIYQTQMDLAAIRAEARNVTAMSGGVVGAMGTLSNYTLGGGLKFTAQQSQSCPQNLSPDEVASLVAEAQRVINRFLRENKFQSDMDREVDRRTREDGEAFVELSVSPAGQIRASFDEPDMICQPFNAAPIEDWLRDQDYQRYSPEWTWSWSFGIHCIRRTPDDPLGYHVVYDTTGEDWEYVPASRMLHVKANVPRNVKRGVSDLYWIANDVQREAKIRRNTADGAALQAAIAWFREHAQGTTTSAVQSMVDGQAIDIRQQRTSSGTRPTKQGKLRSGTVVDIPETMKVLPGPMGSERNSNFILIAQYVARAFAARWAMPEFMFTSDASNANYASTLVAESPFVKAREADQRFYGQAFVELLWKVLRLAHEIGRAFQNIEKFDDLQQILELTATGPRVSNRDELQTVQRQQIEVGMGTLSLETAAAEMGRDLAKEQAKGAHPAGESGGPAPEEDNNDPREEHQAAQSVNEEASFTECSDTIGDGAASVILQDVIKVIATLFKKLAEMTATGASPSEVQLILQELAKVKARVNLATATSFLEESVLECHGKGGKRGPCKKLSVPIKPETNAPRPPPETQGSIALKAGVPRLHKHPLPARQTPPLMPTLAEKKASPAASQVNQEPKRNLDSRRKSINASRSNAKKVAKTKPTTRSAREGRAETQVPAPSKGNRKSSQLSHSQASSTDLKRERSTGSNPSSTRLPPSALASAQALDSSKIRFGQRHQQFAEEDNQDQLAKEVRGLNTKNNSPVDVKIYDEANPTKLTHGLELKTLLVSKHDRIRMRKSARQNKIEWMSANEVPIHTFVYDDRYVFDANGVGKHDYSKRKTYFKQGIGNFNLDEMHLVSNSDERDKLARMDGSDPLLPLKARPRLEKRNVKTVKLARKRSSQRKK
jgi:hypothetical protein